MALRFSANVSFLYTDLPWEARIAAAAKAGFAAVELNPPFPYLTTPAEFANLLTRSELVCPLIIAPLGEGRAAMGHACVPGERAAFRNSIDKAIEYACAASVPLLHPSAGRMPDDAARAEAEAVYVENIAWAAERTAAAGIRLCIEPVSAIRAPGFFLQTTTQAAEYVERAGNPDIGLVFDTFHVAVQEGAMVQKLTALLPRVAHVQISDTPNRQTPGAGDLDFSGVFSLLQARGYAGWVGCEYTPSDGALESYSWALRWSDRPLKGRADQAGAGWGVDA